jgi:hypothetical protein
MLRGRFLEIPEANSVCGGTNVCKRRNVHGQYAAFLLRHSFGHTEAGRWRAPAGDRQDAVPVDLERLQRVTSTAREYLAPHQVAVGLKSGCDLVVQEARSAIDEHGADDTYVLVCVDARNAFNKAKRANMLTAVEQHVPALERLTYAIYGQQPCCEPATVSLSRSKARSKDASWRCCYSV